MLFISKIHVYDFKAVQKGFCKIKIILISCTYTPLFQLLIKDTILSKILKLKYMLPDLTIPLNEHSLFYLVMTF
jgi:hypothetical protein